MNTQVLEISTHIDENKTEDFDAESRKMIEVRYFIEKVITFEDYRMHSSYEAMITRQQRRIFQHWTFVAQNEEMMALSGIKSNPSSTMWIGDTGASCHMSNNDVGLFETRKGSGGIKVGSGKILKIEKVGKLRAKVFSKQGADQIIVLKDVHYVPELYCNLFSITKALDEGFALSGGQNQPLTLRKNNVTIKFDCEIKS